MSGCKIVCKQCKARWEDNESYVNRPKCPEPTCQLEFGRPKETRTPVSPWDDLPEIEMEEVRAAVDKVIKDASEQTEVKLPPINLHNAPGNIDMGRRKQNATPVTPMRQVTATVRFRESEITSPDYPDDDKLIFVEVPKAHVIHIRPKGRVPG